MTASTIAAGPAVQKANLEKVQREMEASKQLLAGFYLPWDESDTRPLCILKDVLNAQERALSTLMLMVEAQDRQIAYLKARNQYQEAYTS